MSVLRVALGNVRFPTSRDESIQIVQEAMVEAARGGASIICFPECVVPGYRIGNEAEAPHQMWLQNAWAAIDALAAELNIWVILGTERIAENGLRITARVTNSNGIPEGFQDKVQLDPSEETTYVPGETRRLFQIGDIKFGIVICHEGWRYPETVRWAAMNGAHIVFHPHVEIIGETQTLPLKFADPENSFHEKAALCRAAENTCYFATVNCALKSGTSTTSALIDPEGNLLVHHTYGKEGVLIGDIDSEKATGLLAERFKPPVSGH
jgi:predicted amidohydrolase